MCFIVLNLFFYSFISIGLYKFICYDSQNEYFKLFFSEKERFVFFYDSYFNYYFSSSCFYNTFLSFSSFFNEKSIFYSFSPLLKINFFSYITVFSDFSNKELNLIFLNFYIRSSNLN